MDIRKLRQFIAVADAGSINRAAKDYGISQAGLTKSMRLLEQELQTTLFHRKTSGVELTRNGSVLLEHARQLVRVHSNAEKAIELEKEGVGLPIRIGVAPRWFLLSALPELISKIEKKSKTHQIKIFSGLKSWEMIPRLKNGEYDFLIATPTEFDDLSGLRLETLMLDPQGVVVKKGHPLTCKKTIELTDLTDFKWVIGPKETYFRKHLESLFISAGMVPPEPFLEVDSNVLILDVISKTDYIGISTEELVRQNSNGKIEMLNWPPKINRVTAILSRENDILSNSVKNLICSMRLQFPQN